MGLQGYDIGGEVNVLICCVSFWCNVIYDSLNWIILREHAWCAMLCYTLCLWRIKYASAGKLIDILKSTKDDWACSETETFCTK